MFTEIFTDISYFNQDTKQSSYIHFKMQKNHKVHVSLHMVAFMRHPVYIKVKALFSMAYIKRANTVTENMNGFLIQLGKLLAFYISKDIAHRGQKYTAKPTLSLQ